MHNINRKKKWFDLMRCMLGGHKMYNNNNYNINVLIIICNNWVVCIVCFVFFCENEIYASVWRRRKMTHWIDDWIQINNHTEQIAQIVIENDLVRSVCCFAHVRRCVRAHIVVFTHIRKSFFVFSPIKIITII